MMTRCPRSGPRSELEFVHAVGVVRPGLVPADPGPADFGGTLHAESGLLVEVIVAHQATTPVAGVGYLGPRADFTQPGGAHAYVYHAETFQPWVAGS